MNLSDGDFLCFFSHASAVVHMGCGGSKVDDQPLVILCKERKELLRAASHHRLALAAAHLAYFQSLRDVGEAIRRFVDEELVISGSPVSPDSPVLTLPSVEGKPRKPKISSSSTSISHSAFQESNSDNNEHDEEEEDTEGSHLQLSSGSEAGSDASECHTHIHVESSPEKKENERPLETFPPGYGSGYGYGYPVGGWGLAGGNPGVYYMKRSAPTAQSVFFQPSENRRVENGQWPPEPSYRKMGHFPAYVNPGFSGHPSLPMDYAPHQRAPSSPPPPPPAPPSPPRVSTWDYLNVFGNYDYNNNGASGYPGYYPQSKFGLGSNSSSPDSIEVRQREGIPDLEEETEQEVIKEAYKEKTRKKKTVKEHEHGEIGKSKMNRKRYSSEGTSRPVPVSSESSSCSDVVFSPLHRDEATDFTGHGNEGKGSSSASGHETIVTKSSQEEEYGRKKGVTFEVEETTTTSFDVESSKMSSLTTLSVQGTRDLREVVKEIKNEFDVASSYGKEVAVLLEVSKLPYQQKNTWLKVIFSRIMYLVAPSMLSSRSKPQPSVKLTSRTLKMAKAYNGQDFTGNLSSTLEKLYAWEKKLCKEVKDEEKLRVIYEEQCKILKRLDHQGAESGKIDATRASITKLLTKINVCIRSVDSISSRIHKLRDEELHPQLTEFIHGLIRMWRSMLKCHQKQFQAIMESKARSLKANTGFKRDSGLKATLDLEMELREWCSHFNSWIKTQKSYVDSLSGWVSKCLLYEPEETDDGFAPFSPSRVGAPPIFTVCKDWQEAMATISGENVSNAMQRFASSLHELWERQDEEHRQRVKAEDTSHDFEKRLNNLRTERAKLEKNQDMMSEKTVVSRVRSDSGISSLDDLKVDLDSMRKKIAEERARHKEAIKLVHTAASSSLQAGLIPIFEALGSFTSEVVKAHEHVRLQHSQTS